MYWFYWTCSNTCFFIWQTQQQVDNAPVINLHHQKKVASQVCCFLGGIVQRLSSVFLLRQTGTDWFYWTPGVFRQTFIRENLIFCCMLWHFQGFSCLTSDALKTRKRLTVTLVSMFQSKSSSLVSLRLVTIEAKRQRLQLKTFTGGNETKI